MSKVRLALRHTEGEAAADKLDRAAAAEAEAQDEAREDGPLAIAQCACCLRTPRTEVMDCRRCDAVLCPTCLEGRRECPICGQDFTACPPRRNKWAERLIRRTRRM